MSRNVSFKSIKWRKKPNTGKKSAFVCLDSTVIKVVVDNVVARNMNCFITVSEQ